MRRLAATLALALAGLGVACAPDFTGPSRMLARGGEPEREPLQQRRTAYYDREHTRVRREWGIEMLADGTTRPHGRDVQNFADGQREFEREFLHGEPAGQWRTWWPDGKRRMEAEHGTREPRPMRWWHENGQLASEGPARNGVKEGDWRHYHPNGTLASAGRYSAGERQGEWSFFDERGALLERVDFHRGKRQRVLEQPVQ